MQKGFGGHMPERRNNRIAETSFVVTVKSENLQFATAVLHMTQVVCTAATMFRAIAC